MLPLGSPYFSFILVLMQQDILILLMQLDSAILSQISTKNIISVTVSQSQLETNFELILKALQNHDALLKDQNGQLKALGQKINSNDFRTDIDNLDKRMKMQLDGVGKKIKGNAAKISKIEQKLAELSALSNDLPDVEKKSLKKEGHQSSSSSSSSELTEAMFKLEAKVKKMEGQIKALQGKVNEIESLSERQDKTEETISGIEAKMKQEQQAISILQEQLSKLRSDMSRSPGSRQRTPSGKSDKGADLDGQIKKLNAILLVLKGEYDSFSKEVTEKLETLLKNAEMPQKDKDNYEEMMKKMKKMTDDIWKLNEQLYVSDKHNREVEGMNQSKFDALNRTIKEIEGKLDNLKSESTSHKTIVSARQAVTSEWSPQNNRPEEHSNDPSPKKEERDLESLNFKKDILDKLKQQRVDFNKAIKRLDNVTNRKEEDVSKFGELQDRILRLQRLIDGKMDEDGLKKWMKYIQNKINILYQILNTEGNQEDAYIARKNWTCLSCDKKLEAYRGRVGSHLISAQLKSKGVDSEVVGGGMLFKAKSKLELPQFKK